MEELLKVLYERNEQYHDTKERVVWLAGTIYFAFSFAVLVWIFEHENVLACKEVYISIFLSLIFALTSAFIILQTWQKCISAVKTTKFHDLIRNLDEEIEPKKYRTLIDRTTSHKKGEASLFREGWSGLLVFGVVLTFYLAQITLLHGLSKTVPVAWVLGVLLIALLAHDKFNRKWWVWLLVSLFASPVFGVLTLFIVGQKKKSNKQRA